MPYCESKGRLLNIVVLFSVISLGALISSTFAVLFAVRYFRDLSAHDRRNSIWRMSAVIMSALAVERPLRLCEFAFRYSDSRDGSFSVAWQSLYHSCNVVSITGFLFVLLLLQTHRLQNTFAGTAFKLTKKDTRIIYGLTGGTMLAVYSWSICNGIKSISQSQLGYLIGLGLATMAFLLSFSALFLLDWMLVVRLRDAVIRDTARQKRNNAAEDSRLTLTNNNHSRNARVSDPPKQMPKDTDHAVVLPPQTNLHCNIRSDSGSINDSRQHNETDLDTDMEPSIESERSVQLSGKVEERNTISGNRVAFDVDSNRDDSHGISQNVVSPSEVPTLRKQSTLQAIQQSNLDGYESGNRQILKSASRASVLAMWFTVAVFWFFVSMLLFVLSDCDQWGSIIGHLLMALGHGIASTTLYVSLPNSKSKALYIYCCYRSHLWLQRLIAYNTDRHLTFVTQSQLRAESVLSR